jgi:hypothetical protein
MSRVRRFVARRDDTGGADPFRGAAARGTTCRMLAMSVGARRTRRGRRRDWIEGVDRGARLRSNGGRGGSVALVFPIVGPVDRQTSTSGSLRRSKRSPCSSTASSDGRTYVPRRVQLLARRAIVMAYGMTPPEETADALARVRARLWRRQACPSCGRDVHMRWSERGVWVAHEAPECSGWEEARKEVERG